MGLRVCPCCFEICPFTFLQCPHCKSFSRCFVEHCARKPSNCIGAFFLLCPKHVSECEGVVNAKPHVKKRFGMLPPPMIPISDPLPTPLVSINHTEPDCKKGTLLFSSFKKKRKFNLPPSSQVKSLIHTVKHAMRHSLRQNEEEDIKAAELLHQWKIKNEK